MSSRRALLALAVLLLVLPLAGADAASPGPSGRIVYVDGGSIHTAAADGSGAVDTGVAGTSPSWSPAADRIAFRDASGKLATMTSTGGSVTEVESGGSAIAASAGSAIAWSPDGSLIAYASGSGIFTIAAPAGGSAGSATATPLVNGAGNTDPTWSPNGSKLAFVSTRDGDAEVYTMNSDGSGQTRLTTSSGSDIEPSWSPDGTDIAFATDRGQSGTYQIYSMPAAGGSEVRLTNDSTDDRAPTWSPGGTEIAFTQGGKLSTMTPAGTGVAQIGSSTSEADPEWGLAFGVVGAPSISFSGSLAPGTVLTADPGTWSGSNPSFSYQWLRCNSAGASCGAISGATAQTYTVTAADGGSTIRVTVTDTEAGIGSSSATSAQVPSSGVVGSTGPANTSSPEIRVVGAAPIQDTRLTATAGTWSGSPPLTFAFQWEQCDEGGDNCSLAGGTASTYTPTAGDVGHTLRVKVTATNAAGSTTVQSSPTKVVRGLLPAPVLPPTVSNLRPVVGQRVFGTVGTWSGRLPITLTYEFEKCNADGSTCIPLPTPSTSIPVTIELVGWRIAFHVWATNSLGEVNARSVLSQPVETNPPVVSTRPAISGINAVGQQLQAAPGTWRSTAGIVTYAYVWQRCDPYGNGCKPIPGAAGTTYVLTQADLGAAIRVYVTATNAGGSATAPSDHTYPTTPRLKLKPGISSPPTILDAPAIGVTLRSTDGIWTGDRPIRFAHRWRRCDATGSHCKLLNARRRIYTVTTADLGHTLRVVVTAKNANGATSAISEATDTIQLTRKPRPRRIVGTKGPNYLPGGGGDDTLIGRGGSDTLLGGAGDDTLDGGAGNDILIGGAGKDTLLGRTGSDTIIANDGEPDVVDCGPGRDRAIVDEVDRALGCEVVQTLAPPTTTSTTTTGETATTGGTTTDETMTGETTTDDEDDGDSTPAPTVTTITIPDTRR